MEHTVKTWLCDRCGVKLPGHSYYAEIVTEQAPSSLGFLSRLHIQFIREHGFDNNITKDRAELCKACTTDLLRDALHRVTSGERISAGCRSVDKEKW